MSPVALSPCKERVLQQYSAENCYNNSHMRFLSSDHLYIRSLAGLVKAQFLGAFEYCDSGA